MRRVQTSSITESIVSLIFAYYAFTGETPGYTEIFVTWAEWHDRGNL